MQSEPNRVIFDEKSGKLKIKRDVDVFGQRLDSNQSILLMMKKDSYEMGKQLEQAHSQRNLFSQSNSKQNAINKLMIDSLDMHPEAEEDSSSSMTDSDSSFSDEPRTTDMTTTQRDSFL